MSNFSETFVNPPEKAKESRALLVIGGITYKNYAIGDLLKFAKGYSTSWTDGASLIAFGNKDSKYSMIKEINCEQLLDSKALNFLGNLWLLGLPARLWDRFGDYFKIIGNKEIMKKCTALVEQEILDAKAKYGKVDVIAHSLGTLILLASCSRVNNVLLLGSPLSSRFWSIRTTANKFFEKNGNCKCNSLLYCHSKNDIVGTNDFSGWFNCLDCSPVTHSFSEYLQRLIDDKIVEF